MLKRRYVPDLQQMAAVCEGNFVRLNKLLPDFALGAEQTFIIYGDSDQDPQPGEERCASVTLRVVESFTYTSGIEVIQHGLCPAWIQPPKMLVRIYHDACSAEVISYQNQKRIHGRYQYPNPEMRLPDEKAQLNQFLAEWLTHCIRYGHANLALDFSPIRD